MPVVITDKTKDGIRWRIRTIPVNAKDPHGRVNVSAHVGGNGDPLSVGRSQTLANPGAMDWAYAQVPELVVIRRARALGAPTPQPPTPEEQQAAMLEKLAAMPADAFLALPVVTTGTTNPGQAAFRKAVMELYGEKCAVCEVVGGYWLHANHIEKYAVRNDNSPFNGIPLCRLHHRPYDDHKFTILLDGTIQVLADEDLYLTKTDISHLDAFPGVRYLQSNLDYWERKRA